MGVLILLLALAALTASSEAARTAHDHLLKAQSDATAVTELSNEFQFWKWKIDEQLANRPHYTGPLLDSVTQMAARHAIVLSDIATSGDQRLSARIEGVTFEQVISWLYDLHMEATTQIGNITFQRSSEPGKVNVQATLFRE